MMFCSLNNCRVVSLSNREGSIVAESRYGYRRHKFIKHTASQVLGGCGFKR